MKSNIVLILFIAISLVTVCSTDALAQHDDIGQDNKLILKSSWGNQRWLDVSYVYKTQLISGAFLKQVKQGKNSKIYLYLRPQYGRTTYLYSLLSSIFETASEYGLGIGARIDWNVYRNRIDMFLDLESGPHFISEPLERQVKGFLFSNHINFGLSLTFTEKWSVEVSSGFRHMSNAETRLPNGGLNNVFFGIGLGMNI
jgi:hypothetical protein